MHNRSLPVAVARDAARDTPEQRRSLRSTLAFNRPARPVRDTMDGLNRPYRRDRTTAFAYVFNSSLTGFQVALGAIMPVIRDDLDISLTIASLHFTIMAVCGMLGSLCTADIARKFGRRVTTYVSLTCSLAGLIVICLAPSVAMTLTGSVLLGIFGPLGIIVSQAEMMDKHRSHRGVALADLSFVISVAMLATVLGAGPIVSITDSWRIALMMPTIALATTYLVLRPLRFTDAQSVGRPRSKHRMTGLAWLFCLTVASQSSFEWCYGYLGAEFMDKAGGLSKGSAATAMALYYTGLVLGRFILVPAVRRVPSFTLLMASFSIALVGFLIMALGPNTEVILIGLFVSGLGISFTFPMITNLAGAAFPDATDWIIGRLFLAGGIAIAIAPFAVGSLADQIGIASSFWVVGGIGLAGLLITPILNRHLIATDDMVARTVHVIDLPGLPAQSLICPIPACIDIADR